MKSLQSFLSASKLSIHAGAIPSISPPLSSTALETAPIIPVSPPPKTNLCPLFAISSPSLYPSSMYLDFIFLLPAP